MKQIEPTVALNEFCAREIQTLQKILKKQPVPRHGEVDEHLARHIIKELT